ncbi:MAG: rhodanese-like domain-containing protein [Deltaproteobacteria bacterium]|nr:rhodanese-like domain-containing protein [Deltaproteobacteria bacterium]
MTFHLPSRRRTPAFTDVLPNQLGDSSRYRIVDVRGPDEFHGPLGHLPNAQLLPLPLLPRRLESLGLKHDEPVLLVCRSGGRSAQAAAYLVSQGYTSVHNLSGGMMRWQREGMDACVEHHGADFARCSKAA